MDYGHWCTKKVGKFDPVDFLAFTYEIEFVDGSKYIGVKKMWISLKRPPGTYKRKPKKPFRESKWRSYDTSSNVVAAKMLAGDKIKKRKILNVYTLWGTAMYDEQLLQLKHDVLAEDSVYLNQQVGGMTFRHGGRKLSKEHDSVIKKIKLKKKLDK